MLYLKKYPLQALGMRVWLKFIVRKEILLDTMFSLPGVEGVDEIVVNADVVQKKIKPLYIYDKSNKVINKKA